MVSAVPPAARKLVGLLTMGLLLVVGFSFLKEQPVVGALLLCLGAYRGWVLAREWRPRPSAEEEPADQPEPRGRAGEPDD